MSTKIPQRARSAVRERLLKAVRAMEGLTEERRAKNFDVNLFAREGDVINAFFSTTNRSVQGRYLLPRPATVDDALGILRRAIDDFPGSLSALSLNTEANG